MICLCVDSLNASVGALRSEQELLQISIVSEKRDHVGFCNELVMRARRIEPVF
jgi:hypothetical protein